MRENRKKIWLEKILNVVLILVVVVVVVSIVGTELNPERNKFKLTASYDLVQMDYELNENIKTSKKTDVVFLILYSNVATNIEEEIEYEDQYTFWYKRQDGGIIKDNITIPEYLDNEEVVVLYPLKEGERPRIEIYYRESMDEYEYRFHVDEDTILKVTKTK